jgi:hypothetical protein
MSDTERLIQEIRRLPKDSVAQVLDFVGSLKRKTAAAAYVCPYCGKTEHVPNAATIAAFEEGDAMLREAAEKAAPEYAADPELTAFCALDGEDFL